MRLGLLLIPCAIALLAAAACSSPQPAPGGLSGGGDGEDGDTPVPERTTEQANSCLGKVGLAFEKAACNTCMSEQSCCTATIACFQGSTKTECATLQECMSACGGGGNGTGPGTGAGDAGTTGTGTGTGMGNAAAKTNFVTKVYPSLSGTCAGCHAAGGAGGQLFGANGDTTYPIFKNSGYDKANSGLVQKGAHTGPALTAAQKQLINDWVALEATGGGGGGGGGMGDGGAGDGGGGGGGNATKIICQNACRTKHAAAVPKWDAYNTCVAKTCASSCL